MEYSPFQIWYELILYEVVSLICLTIMMKKPAILKHSQNIWEKCIHGCRTYYNLKYYKCLYIYQIFKFFEVGNQTMVHITQPLPIEFPLWAWKEPYYSKERRHFFIPLVYEAKK